MYPGTFPSSENLIPTLENQSSLYFPFASVFTVSNYIFCDYLIDVCLFHYFVSHKGKECVDQIMFIIHLQHIALCLAHSQYPERIYKMSEPTRNE